MFFKIINYKRGKCCASVSWFLVFSKRSLLCTCLSIFEMVGCSACCVTLRVPLASKTFKVNNFSKLYRKTRCTWDCEAIWYQMKCCRMLQYNIMGKNGCVSLGSGSRYNYFKTQIWNKELTVNASYVYDEIIVHLTSGAPLKINA
jgi:hypothetical protein